MQPDHRARYTFGFALLAALLAALILWNLNTGSLHLSPAEVMDILLTRTGENAAIVWEMRLPRLIAAMLLGCRFRAFCSRPFSPTPSQARSCSASPRARS